MSSSRTRSSAFPASQSAPSSSSMRDSSERRSTSHKGRRAKELTCESCGKVYKHPVCLQKHRWEHNPLWRDTAQLLLSKHQQVQVMEAAAILLHGTSLPPDRALWPSIMSGGTLPSPKFAGDGTTREQTPQLHHHRAASPAATVSSSARGDAPPTSQFDDDELEEASEIEDGEDEEEDGIDDDELVIDEEDENTDESVDVPMTMVDPAAAMHARTRSQSIGLAAPVQSHMPNLAGSYGVGSHMLPSSLAMTAAYGWGVITESGQHGSFNGAYGTKSPISESQYASQTSPRSPVAINPHVQHHQQHRSMSSFGSFTHSFGSSSTSSYIPSSSLRSSSDMNNAREDEDGDEDLRESMRGVEMNDNDDDNDNEEGEDAADTFDYYSQRATTLCRRLTAVSKGSNTGTATTTNNTGSGSSAYYGHLYTGSDAGRSKTNSPDRRREEDIYELEMDMD